MYEALDLFRVFWKAYVDTLESALELCDTSKSDTGNVPRYRERNAKERHRALGKQAFALSDDFAPAAAWGLESQEKAASLEPESRRHTPEEEARAFSPSGQLNRSVPGRTRWSEATRDRRARVLLRRDSWRLFGEPCHNKEETPGFFFFFFFFGGVTACRLGDERLLSHAEFVTLCHEWGHVLHSALSAEKPGSKFSQKN